MQEHNWFNYTLTVGKEGPKCIEFLIAARDHGGPCKDFYSWIGHLKRTHKKYFLQDREGYDRSETTCEKLWPRRIHWCRDSSSIFTFCQDNVENRQKCPNKLGSTHHWMHLTARLAMDCRVGLRWHFCCGCPISKPRPDLGFSSKKSGVIFLFFWKVKKWVRTAKNSVFDDFSENSIVFR